MGTTFACYRVFFDGSCASNGSGGGWILYGSNNAQADTEDEWTRVASLSFCLQAGATVTSAELEAALWGVAYVRARLSSPVEATNNLKNWKTLDTSRLRILCLAELVE